MATTQTTSEHASKATVDPIADVIALLRPRAVISASLRANGPWGIRFEGYPHVKFGTIVEGHCWIALDGVATPVLLNAGDFYLLGNPPSYFMASDLDVPLRPAKPIFAAAREGVIRVGAGRRSAEATHIVGGHFAFDEHNASLLLEVLPPLLRVRTDTPEARRLGILNELLAAEVAGDLPGRSLVLDRLAQILLVHALRAHGTDQTRRGAGWLGALADPQIGGALRRMHADVARRWKLEELAASAGMSRSAFALRFKATVGTAPLDYLIQWRMKLARDALRHGTKSIAELAFAVGYESESAFSTAFRRVVGKAPKPYRLEARESARSAE